MVATDDLITNGSAQGDAADADLAAFMNAVIEHGVAPMYSLGIRVVDLRPGHVIGAAPLTGNVNHLGTMYAGTLFGLAEMLGGALFVANFDVERFHPTVKDVQIRYRRPATTDVRAEASLDADTIVRLRREADHHGKAEFVLDATITDATGEVVASTRGTYQVRANATGTSTS
ncbi:PaaI family thioesterase [Amycolatopsis pittospori]|uniref:PaaI family thioesterase n=1 Tax=Amycolatopsis pittospori TaxID=2749434 RepID=UPI001A9EBAF4|nr:YiiD C-terminal domain-containing protein [Amycolatopsis pittospori]